MPQSPEETSAFARWLDSVIGPLYPDDASLARAVGVSQSTVLRWRRGSKPKPGHLVKLSKATRTSVETLTLMAAYDLIPPEREAREVSG